MSGHRNTPAVPHLRYFTWGSVVRRQHDGKQRSFAMSRFLRNLLPVATIAALNAAMPLDADAAWGGGFHPGGRGGGPIILGHGRGGSHGSYGGWHGGFGWRTGFRPGFDGWHGAGWRGYGFRGYGVRYGWGVGFGAGYYPGYAGYYGGYAPAVYAPAPVYPAPAYIAPAIVHHAVYHHVVHHGCTCTCCR
jgi:hypothetical protein